MKAPHDMADARWPAALFPARVLTCTLWIWILGCGGEPPVPGRSSPVASTVATAIASVAATSVPEIAIAADGAQVLAPRISDVAMLQRLPDGTYKRLCGAPDVQTRTMLEGIMRSRRRSAK
jgi:hypothetical protein